jgi:hypothetical protein
MRSLALTEPEIENTDELPISGAAEKEFARQRAIAT